MFERGVKGELNIRGLFVVYGIKGGWFGGKSCR